MFEPGPNGARSAILLPGCRVARNRTGGCCSATTRMRGQRFGLVRISNKNLYLQQMPVVQNHLLIIPNTQYDVIDISKKLRLLFSIKFRLHLSYNLQFMGVGVNYGLNFFDKKFVFVKSLFFRNLSFFGAKTYIGWLSYTNFRKKIFCVNLSIFFLI